MNETSLCAVVEVDSGGTVATSVLPSRPTGTGGAPCPLVALRDFLEQKPLPAVGLLVEVEHERPGRSRLVVAVAKYHAYCQAGKADPTDVPASIPHESAPAPLQVDRPLACRRCSTWADGLTVARLQVGAGDSPGLVERIQAR